MNLLTRLASPRRTRAIVELAPTMPGEPVERIGENFRSFVSRAYQDNGVVWAAVVARLVLFSQIDFRLQSKTTGELSPLPPRLRILERPWPGGTTAELLARVEQDTSLAGNYYILRADDRLQRLRPDWVDIITNGREPIGYAYYPNGDRSRSARVLPAEEVAHGKPYPDPLKAFVGNSWVTAVVKDILADQAMNHHKLRFFENAATPNLLLKFQQTLNPEQKDELRSILKQRHEGVDNAYRTLVVEGGADAQIIGSQFEQMAFGEIQAAGENRVAVASRVPSVVLGIKEGAAQATYSNYGQAVRAFSDHTMRHLWAHVCGVLENIVPVPSGQRLWYDDRHIAALQADARDEAEIRQVHAVTIRQLVDAGFDPVTVVEAVTSGDFTVLEHTDLYSVQLQPPNPDEPDTDIDDSDEDEADVDDRFARIIADLKTL